MFLIMLGGSLALGGGLFVLASYSEGTLVPARTAALVVGWLFVLATLGGVAALRRPNPGALIAASVTLASGLLVLYIAHFEWTDMTMPAAHAAVEVRAPNLKVIEAPAPALSAALGMKEIVIPEMPKAQAHTPLLAAVALDACSALGGLESLQCRRGCGEKSGIAWVVCQESARLEYCQGRPHDEATCPSPIPHSYPG